MKCPHCGEAHDDGEPVWLTNHLLQHIVGFSATQEKSLLLLTQDFRRLVEVLEANDRARVQMQLDINHLAEVHAQVRAAMATTVAELDGRFKLQTGQLEDAVQRIRSEVSETKGLLDRVLELESRLKTALEAMR